MGESFRHCVIRWVGFDGRGELIGSDACELHESVIHGAGVDVFPLGAGQYGAAFIDHPREMDMAF